jgi:hypothetical protein
MTLTDESDGAGRMAESIYAARSALAEVEPASGGLGIAELAQFLSDPQRNLTMEQQRRLFSDRNLRADYLRLKSLFSEVELPALAAASAGEVNERQFKGGSVRIHPSKVGGQVYVIFKFTSPPQPHTLLLEGAGELIKRALPATDAGGEAMMVIDPSKSADKAFLHLLSDPRSNGSFLL